MSKFTVLTIAGNRFDAPDISADVYEAETAEDVVRQLAEAHDMDDEQLDALLEMTTDEGDHWSVYDEETMHYIVKVE